MNKNDKIVQALKELVKASNDLIELFSESDDVAVCEQAANEAEESVGACSNILKDPVFKVMDPTPEREKVNRCVEKLLDSGFRVLSINKDGLTIEDCINVAKAAIADKRNRPAVKAQLETIGVDKVSDIKDQESMFSFIEGVYNVVMASSDEIGFDTEEIRNLIASIKVKSNR